MQESGRDSYIEIHYGQYCEEDVRQISCLGDIEDVEGVEVVKVSLERHDFIVISTLINRFY